MKDRYNDFAGRRFRYVYPIQWRLRNRWYLKKAGNGNRPPYIDFMTYPRFLVTEDNDTTDNGNN